VSRWSLATSQQNSYLAMGYVSIIAQCGKKVQQFFCSPKSSKLPKILLFSADQPFNLQEFKIFLAKVLTNW
jgi:hypothetical protein